MDAKGVSRLYRQQVRKRDLMMMVASAVFALIIVMAMSAPIRLMIRTAWVNLTNIVQFGALW